MHGLLFPRCGSHGTCYVISQVTLLKELQFRKSYRYQFHHHNCCKSYPTNTGKEKLKSIPKFHPKDRVLTGGIPSSRPEAKQQQKPV